MKRRFAVRTLLGLVAVVFATAAVGAQPRETKAAPAKPSRIDGTIQAMDNTAKTLTLRVRGNVPRTVTVVWTDTTGITFRNKTSSLDEVRVNRRVIVQGRMNDKGQMVATRIDVRDEK